MLSELKRRLGIQAQAEITKQPPELAEYPRAMEYLMTHFYWQLSDKIGIGLLVKV